MNFIERLREACEVIVVSDTFYQFAGPLIRQLGWPTLLCNTLEIDDSGVVVDYHLRQPDQKRKSIQALKSLAFNVIAAGDSYNDLSMLSAADSGILFRPPEQIAKENPQYPVVHTHDELFDSCQNHIQSA